MKKYSFEKIDNILLITVKSVDTKKGSIYLDALKDNEFSVSIDDNDGYIFSNIVDAVKKFEELETKAKK